MSEETEVEVEEEIMVCERCNRPSDQFYEVSLGRHETELWCYNCRMSTALMCEGCQVTYSTRYVYMTTVGDYHFCGECVERLPFCDECEEYYLDGMEDQHQHRERVINSYSHKPGAVFHPEYPRMLAQPRYGATPVTFPEGKPIDRRSLLQFGIELEVENEGRESLESVAYDFFSNFDASILCLKHDGSLYNGFEIVTQPRSLESWRNFAPEFGTALLELRRRGFRSWNNNHCGLHIHASNIAFDGASHLTRFGLLFSRNEEGWISVAGRDTRNNGCNYASFDGLRRGGVANKAKGLYPTEHTDAVNLNTHYQPTVEVRIWRPSLAGSGRVMSSIEFVHAAIEYTRSITSHDIGAGALRWTEFVKYIAEHDYPQAQFVLGGGRFEKVNS